MKYQQDSGIAVDLNPKFSRQADCQRFSYIGLRHAFSGRAKSSERLEGFVQRAKFVSAFWGLYEPQRDFLEIPTNCEHAQMRHIFAVPQKSLTLLDGKAHMHYSDQPTPSEFFILKGVVQFRRSNMLSSLGLSTRLLLCEVKKLAPTGSDWRRRPARDESSI